MGGSESDSLGPPLPHAITYNSEYSYNSCFLTSSICQSASCTAVKFDAETRKLCCPQQTLFKFASKVSVPPSAVITVCQPER